jgi:glyoxylase-like metal-dependent hydrolase (beta-lactamase superfamily II)
MVSAANWDDPAPEDLGNGIYRIPLPLPNDGLRAVNVYALQGSTGLSLIDAGWALTESFERLTRSLKEFGFELGEIEQCLVTHVHRDHYTQALTLRREVGVPVSLGDGERRNLEQINDWADKPDTAATFGHLQRAGSFELLAMAQAHQVQTDRREWELPDHWLQDRQQVIAGDRTLTAIRTPGHTQGHVVFHDPDGRHLFAGDHVLPHITPSIGFEPIRSAFPLRDYLDSLRLMFTLPDSVLLPAHGAVGGSVHSRVTELLAHHDDRLADTEAVVRAGAASADDAARALTWTRRRRSFAELDVLNQMLAVSETAAHLDVLVLQGRLSSSTGPDGVEFYRA